MPPRSLLRMVATKTWEHILPAACVEPTPVHVIMQPFARQDVRGVCAELLQPGHVNITSRREREGEREKVRSCMFHPKEEKKTSTDIHYWVLYIVIIVYMKKSFHRAKEINHRFARS